MLLSHHSKQNNFLNIARTLAILMVIACHTISGNQYFQHEIIDYGLKQFPLIRYGWAGVDLFFVLSGYLIGKQLWEELDQTRKINLFRFFIRRALRIFPLYYFSLILIFFFFNFENYQVGEIIPDLFFLTNYFDEKMIQGSWSLSIEEQFYLLSPIMFILLAFAKHPRKLFFRFSFVFIMIPSILRFFIWKGQVTTGLSETEIIRRFIQRPIICHYEALWIGVLIATGYLDQLKNKKVISLFVVMPALILGALNKVAFGYLGIALSFGLVLIWGISKNFNFGEKIFHLMAKLSYGMYLNHALVMLFVSSLYSKSGILDHNIRWIFIFLTVIVVSMSFAIVSYKLIEEPCLKLRDRLLSNLF